MEALNDKDVKSCVVHPANQWGSRFYKGGLSQSVIKWKVTLFLSPLSLLTSNKIIYKYILCNIMNEIVLQY